MAQYSITRKAEMDLKSIWYYTLDEWSEYQADKYINTLLSAMNRVAKQPTIGQSYHNLVDNLRGYKINKHIIFYRELTDSEVQIVRVLHQRMDIDTRLREG